MSIIMNNSHEYDCILIVMEWINSDNLMKSVRGLQLDKLSG